MAKPSSIRPHRRFRLPLTARCGRRLNEVLNTVWVDYGAARATVEVNFVDEEMIRVLHHNFLNEASATDVITFDLGLTPEGFRVAEIVICLPVAHRHAKKYRVSLRHELQRLIIHGALHLLGYEDATRAGKRRMRHHENKILEQVGHK